MSPAVDLSRYSSIIPEEHNRSLSICFRKIPDFSWLLTSPHSELERLQGDIHMTDKLSPKRRSWNMSRIPCFTSNPSVSSSLKFLRRTPWAREKIEGLYLRYLIETEPGPELQPPPGDGKPVDNREA